MMPKPQLILVLCVCLLLGSWTPSVAEDDLPADQSGLTLISRTVHADGSVSESVALEPSDDAYISSEFDKAMFGASSEMRIGRVSSFGATRSLLKFDVSSIPSNAEIDGARLALYLQSAFPDLDPPMNTTLWRITQDWSEVSVTWFSQPTVGQEYATAVVPRTSGVYNWEIEELVQRWTSGALANFGLIITGDEGLTNERQRIFYASDGTSTVFHPRLYVEYTIPPQLPVTTVSPLPMVTTANPFSLNWSAQDFSGSGIKNYDVRVRFDGGGWTTWLSEFAGTSAVYTATSGDGRYEFEVRARDNAGGVEVFTGVPQTGTLVDAAAPFIAPAQWLPLMAKD